MSQHRCTSEPLLQGVEGDLLSLLPNEWKVLSRQVGQRGSNFTEPRNDFR